MDVDGVLQPLLEVSVEFWDMSHHVFPPDLSKGEVCGSGRQSQCFQES